jgi:hypothetical protein
LVTAEEVVGVMIMMIMIKMMLLMLLLVLVTILVMMNGTKIITMLTSNYDEKGSMSEKCSAAPPPASCK